MPSLNQQFKNIEQLCDNGNNEALQAWSMQSTMSDIGQASLAFVHIEKYLSQQKHRLKDTYACTDAIRPMHSLLITKLHNLIHYDESMTTQHNKVICNAILALSKAESKAYTSILKQGIECKAQDELLATYLHRAMATQLNALFQRLKLKLPIPSQYWKSLHQLFNLASQRNMMGFRLCDGALAWDQRLSLENIYCIALLLITARSNQLTSNQVSSTFEILCESIDLVDLSVSSTQNSDEIVADISSNLGPCFESQLHASDDAILVYLQKNELMHKLSFISQQKSSQMAPLCKHLKQAWAEYTPREDRSTSQHKIGVSLDIKSIHHELIGKQSLESFIGEKAKLAISYDDDDDIDTLKNERCKNIYSNSVIESTGQLISHIIPNWVSLQRSPAESLKCPDDSIQVKLTNKSANGCRILWEGEDLPALDIGDILGLFGVHNKLWVIGEIRWLHHKDSDRIETGIHILSRQPIPVAVDVPLKACMKVNFLPALLFPPSSYNKTPSRILLGKHGFEEGDQIKITQGHEEFNMGLKRRVKQYHEQNLFECGFYSPAQQLNHASH